VEAALEATGGVGVDIVFECAGGSPQEGLAGTETLSQAFKMVRDNGKVCQVAVLEHDAKLDIASVVPRGIQYIGHGAGNRKLDAHALQLLVSKRVKLAPVVTHTLKGLDKLPEAIEITANKAKYGAMYPAQVILT
jgi:threonine dehydrogenase-like Zn-dependent dehydrogenase